MHRRRQSCPNPMLYEDPPYFKFCPTPSPHPCRLQPPPQVLFLLPYFFLRLMGDRFVANSYCQLCVFAI